MKKSEILIKKGNQVILARVLCKFDIPKGKYPSWGVWSYLIGTKNGVYVFDVGPKYNTLLNSRRKLTHNQDLIHKALNKYFSHKNILQIIISHYHHDHSQIAPEIQRCEYEKTGNVPPIRLHQNDLKKKRKPRPYPQSLEKIFKKAGYKNWFLGSPLIDGEQLPESDFFVMHTPGHTSGAVSLISHKHKIMIGGWWINSNIHPLAKTLVKTIDEDKKSFKISTKKTKPFKKYTVYTHHPALPKIRIRHNK
jgi:glyoxylase-like metal-dependent hydrolase (beta-lactamase superfamily II)